MAPSAKSLSTVWDALMLQGGGALGAYEWGVWEALDSQGMDFSLVTGVSIGAVNAAIVSSRGKEASTYLGRFWDGVSDPLADFPFLLPPLQQQYAVLKSLMFGNPAMFLPAWWSSPGRMIHSPRGLGLYDPAPLRKLIEKVVDFRALIDGPRKLVVSAVDVQNGKLTHFDSRREPISVDHLMASGALPPAFPPVRIGERWYWDGGLVTNSPIRHVIGSLAPADRKRILMVELFPREHPAPRNLDDVLNILKDLSYMNRVDLAHERHRQAEEIRSFLAKAVSGNADRLRRLPEFAALAEQYAHAVQLFTISHSAHAEDQGMRDADFSPRSLRRRREEGRHAALEAISRWEKEPGWAAFCCVHHAG